MKICFRLYIYLHKLFNACCKTRPLITVLFCYFWIIAGQKLLHFTFSSDSTHPFVANQTGIPILPCSWNELRPRLSKGHTHRSLHVSFMFCLDQVGGPFGSVMGLVGWAKRNFYNTTAYIRSSLCCRHNITNEL